MNAAAQPLKIAGVQLAGRRDKEENVERVLQGIARAARAGARVVCFPELATTPHFLHEEDDASFALAEPIPGPTTERVGKAAREHSVVVVLPMFERDHDDTFDAAVILGPDGALIGRHRANSLPEGRAGDVRPVHGTRYFRCGRGYPVFATPFGIRLGVVICYERHFPETFRCLALDGADLVLVPSNSYAHGARAPLWEPELVTAAYQNGVAVAAVNRVGPDQGAPPERAFAGNSLILDDTGTVLARGSDAEETLVVASIDVEALRRRRERGFLRHRAPAYAQLAGPLPVDLPNRCFPADLLDLIRGGVVTQLIGAAAHLGIADHLASGPLSVEQLASRVGYPAEPLARMLRALDKFKIFVRVPSGAYELGSHGLRLREDVPGSLRHWAMLMAHEFYWSALGRLSDSLAAPTSGIEHVHGEPIFEYCKRDPRLQKLYEDAMRGIIESEARGVCEAFDFASCSLVVDVGAGTGALLASILDRHPGVRAVGCDLPDVVAVARARLERHSSRCRMEPGDFLRSVPEGGDVYVLSRILHDWDDTAAATILRNCRRAMSPGRTLVIVDRVIDDDDEHPDKVLADINVKLMYGGKERSRAELADLLGASGFRCDRVVALPYHRSLVAATAV